MGKRLLNLYVDDETIQLAKSKQINMSALFRNMMAVEFGVEKGDKLEKLKLMNIKLSTELEKANKIIDRQQSQLKEKKLKDEGWQIA